MNLPYVVEVQERRETVPDENGAVGFSWATIEKRRVNIVEVRASERIAATAVEGTVTHKVTMRNGGRRLKPKDRLMYQDRIFEVDGVICELGRPGKQTATVVEVM